MASANILQELARHQPRTFAHLLHRHALLRPDKEAFSCGPQVVTYRAFDARANALVRALRGMGLCKGDVVGLLGWNSLGHAYVYGAAMKGGFIFSPFNPRLKVEELDYLVNYSECRVLFVGAGLVELANELRPRLRGVGHFVSLDAPEADMALLADLIADEGAAEPNEVVTEDDPVHLIYTSGTTGKPRGALYTHGRAWHDAQTLAVDMSVMPDDRHLQISPLFHIAGNTTFRTILLLGARNTIVGSFDATATLQAIQHQRITHMMMVPTHLVMMLGVADLEQYDLSSVKMLWYGASVMPLEVLKRGIATFGPIFAQGYGQTESGPAICHLSREEHAAFVDSPADQHRLRSVGQPDLGVQLRLVDEAGADVPPGEVGEIIVRSPHVMREYWREPEATREALADGWLHTGDMGRSDTLGYVFIVDRKKDMIISGGENVYAREVEDVLRKHPSVQEVAVIGIPDPFWVERVHAVVVLKPGGSATGEELGAFCKQQLAGYKIPKSVDFVESLPMNATGKVMKTELRVRYGQTSG